MGVSTAVGGSEWKKALFASRPDITSMQLTDVSQAVIIATDGVWEVMDSETSAELVRTWRLEGKTAAQSAQLLCEQAAARGSPDNISASIMYLSV